MNGLQRQADQAAFTHALPQVSAEILVGGRAGFRPPSQERTLSQLGAFGVPVLWGISKDATGSYHHGLTLVPLLFLASAAIALHLRHQIRRRETAITPAVAAA